MQFPNLSHAIDDDDGYFDPTDPLAKKINVRITETDKSSIKYQVWT